MSGRTPARTVEDLDALLAARERELATVRAQLEEQATANAVLRLIGEAPTDLQRVLEAIAERARRLFGARDVAIWRMENEELVMTAVRGRAGDQRRDAGPAYFWARLPLTFNSPVTLAIRERRTVQIPEVEAPDTVDWDPRWRAGVAADGVRAFVAAPMRRDGAAIGAIVVRGPEPHAFTPRLIGLLETFAAEAVVAVEHSRLFDELQEQTRVLADQSRQLEQASRHKSEFLAHMSHELRTPLNAIIGFSELLSEEAGDIGAEAMVPDLAKINTAGKHLLSLINDILDLSKVEAGRMDLELAEFDLAQALDAGRVMLTERASRKGIQLVLDLPDDLGRIEADERKVKQVLFNLLTNAVKFTPEGGRVTVSARRRAAACELLPASPHPGIPVAGGWVEVAVSDTGVGIAPADQAKVFEEFGQAKNQAGQTEGTGLGLTLCKRFVELHGGSIDVQSRPGEGSIFTFSLPVRQRVAPGA